jgi:hypothetical protein
MPDSLDDSLMHFIRWSVFFGVIYFSYKSRGFRLLGWLIGGVIITAALYRMLFTIFSSDVYWFLGLCIIASCFIGHRNDEGKPDQPA